MRRIRHATGMMLLLIALVTLAWLWSPQFVGLFVRAYLEALGVSEVAIEIESVSFQHLQVKRLGFTRATGDPQRVDIRGANLSFSLGELWRGKLHSLRIHKASIHTRAQQTSPGSNIGQVLALLIQPSAQDWPLKVLSVRRLVLVYGASHRFSQRLSLSLTRERTQLSAQIGLWQKTGSRYIDLNLSRPGKLHVVLRALAENPSPPMIMHLSLKEKPSHWLLRGQIEADLEPLWQWLKPWLGPSFVPRVRGGRGELDFSLIQSAIAGPREMPLQVSLISRIQALIVDAASEHEKVRQCGACREHRGARAAVGRGVTAVSGSAPYPRKIFRVAEATFKLDTDVEQRPQRGDGAIVFSGEGQIRSLEAHPVTIGSGTIRFTGTLSRQGSTTELTIGPELTATLEALAHPLVRLPHARISSVASRVDSQRLRLENFLQGAWMSFPARWQATLPLLNTNQFQLKAAPLEVVLSDLDWNSTKRFATVSGSMSTANLVLHTRDLALPCQHVRMDFRADQATLRGKFEISLAEDAGRLDGELIQPLEEGSGRLTFALRPLDFGEEQASLSQFLREWPYAFDLIAGQLAISGELSWTQVTDQRDHDRMTGTLQIRLSEGGGFYQAVWFSGLESDIVLRLAPRLRTARSAHVKAAVVDFGLPLRNAELTLALLRSERGPLPRLVGYDLKAEVLGGGLESQRLVVDANNSVHSIRLHLDELDLAALLALYPFSGLQASGRLDGVMDLMVSEAGISVPKGTLRAVAPGGRIRYRPKGSAEKVKAVVPGSATLFRALEDFRYEVLRAEADYAVDGTLLLKLHLEGNSPRLPANRAVHANLDLEQNVLSLLRTLRLVNGLSTRLDSQVRTHYEKTKKRSREGSRISP
jgi:hypothetical protein